MGQQPARRQVRDNNQESGGMNPRLRQMQPGPRGYRAPAEDEVASDEDMHFGIEGVEDDME